MLFSLFDNAVWVLPARALFSSGEHPKEPDDRAEEERRERTNEKGREGERSGEERRNEKRRGEDMSQEKRRGEKRR